MIKEKITTDEKSIEAVMSRVSDIEKEKKKLISSRDKISADIEYLKKVVTKIDKTIDFCNDSLISVISLCIVKLDKKITEIEKESKESLMNDEEIDESFVKEMVEGM